MRQLIADGLILVGGIFVLAALIDMAIAWTQADVTTMVAAAPWAAGALAVAGVGIALDRRQ